MKRWIHAFPAALLLLSLPAAGQQRRYSAAEVAEGKQLFSVQCQPCHGPNGDLVAGVDMRKGQFKRASTDEEISRIIANGVPGTGMPPFSLPDNSRTALVAYIRSLHESGSAGAVAGDAQHGREIFEGKGGCIGCHRVAGRGARKGPDLSEIGALRNAAALERSLVTPGETILPQERMVRAVTKNGTVITGMRLNEDTHTVQLLDQNERLVSLLKSDLREYTVEKTSPMPSYQDKLTPQEIGDVVAYLLSLKGLP
ncbi:MAG TPA: c-type cytochrome [Bryobacteraceae bacterium]|nr:c-type cytochrome [Bryobacteraceae bacterium]